MPLAYTYADKYLASLVTTDIETRAIDDVEALGTFPAAWVERLTILRSYLLVCMESQKAPDDLFTAKLATYRREFDAALPLARQAQIAARAEAEGIAPSGGGSWFTVDLDRC